MSSTISVHEDVKQKLDALKVHPLESYNDIIVRMLDCYKAEELTEEDTQDVGQSPEDLKAKKFKTIEEYAAHEGIVTASNKSQI